MEHDTIVEEEIRLAPNPSDFPNLGKLRPADRFKMKLISEIKIKANSKLFKIRPLVSPYTGLRLTVYKTKLYIREIMRLTKISDNFGIYSIKHAPYLIY
jgi:hypothetical protein